MAELDDILAKYVKDDGDAVGTLQGVAFIVKGRNGKTLYSKTVGKLNFENDSPPFTGDSVCWIASMTKLITSISAMQLVEKGLIGLDDDLGKTIPSLSNKEVLTGFKDDETPLLVKQTKPITLRHLLTHSSGFTYGAFDPAITKWSKVTGQDLPSGFTVEALKFPLKFQPGDGWVYGVSLDWVGHVIQAVSGLPLDEYMDKHIFQPLNMSSTTFRIAKRPDLTSRRAALGLRSVPREPLTVGPTSAIPNSEDPEMCSGGSGLYSTPNDYVKILDALLSDGGALLQPKSVRMLYQPQLPNNKYIQEVFDSAYHDLYAPEFPKGLRVNYGLGGAVNEEDVPGKRKKGSVMWSGMSNPHWWFDPEAGIAAAFLTHVLPPGDAVVIDLFDELEKAVYKTLA